MTKPPVVHIWLDDRIRFLTCMMDYAFEDLRPHVEDVSDVETFWHVFNHAVENGIPIGTLSFDHELGGRVTGTEICRTVVDQIITTIANFRDTGVKPSLRLHHRDFFIHGHSGYPERKLEVFQMWTDLDRILKSASFKPFVDQLRVGDGE